MNRRRHTAAVVVAAFVAVVAVVAGAAAVAGWRADRVQASAETAEARQDQSVAAPEELTQVAPASANALVPDPEPAVADPALRAKSGTTVARGTAVQVDEVALSAPATVTVRGETRQVTTVYRITISAGPYQVRSAPAIISLDGRPLGVGQETVDLSSLVLLAFDNAVLTGGTLALSYGLPSAAPIVWSTTLEPAR